MLKCTVFELSSTKTDSLFKQTLVTLCCKVNYDWLKHCSAESERSAVECLVPKLISTELRG